MALTKTKMSRLEYYIATAKDIPADYDLIAGGTLVLTTGFNRLGTKVTNLDFNPNATVETEAYIANDNEVEETTGYKPTFSGTGKDSTGDAGLDVIIAVADNLETYDNAKRLFIEVDTGKETAAGIYSAKAYYVSVAVDSFTGEATKEREVSFTLSSASDPIKGDYTLATQTFESI